MRAQWPGGSIVTMPFPTKSDGVNRAVNPGRTILFRLGVRFPGLYRGPEDPT